MKVFRFQHDSLGRPDFYRVELDTGEVVYLDEPEAVLMACKILAAAPLGAADRYAPAIVHQPAPPR